jgi:hypothetical protein
MIVDVLVDHITLLPVNVLAVGFRQLVQFFLGNVLNFL